MTGLYSEHIVCFAILIKIKIKLKANSLSHAIFERLLRVLFIDRLCVLVCGNLSRHCIYSESAWGALLNNALYVCIKWSRICLKQEEVKRCLVRFFFQGMPILELPYSLTHFGDITTCKFYIIVCMTIKFTEFAFSHMLLVKYLKF